MTTKDEQTPVQDVGTSGVQDKLPTHEFGRIDEDGAVWVLDEGTERQIGSFPEGLPEDPFGLYVRRFLDLESAISLFESRLPSLSNKDLDQTLDSLQKQVVQPNAIGDLEALRKRVAQLPDKVNARKTQLAEEKKVARQEALAAREAVVAEAEKIAATPTEKIQWKHSGQQLQKLLDEWKNLQRNGPRMDKKEEDGLWKRFSQARTSFDRQRRQFFASLTEQQNETKKLKEALIAKAESLQNSTDWRETSLAQRALLEEWKKAGRAGHREDEALWKRFRDARQVFFDARKENDKRVDEQYAGNLVLKQELVEEAKALLPVKNLEKAREKLRNIQERWEEIGPVPSRDVRRVEGELSRVENAVRDAEQEEWQRTDPETKARAEGMLSQLEASIAELEATITEAKAKGDDKVVTETQKALEVKQTWLKQITASMD